MLLVKLKPLILLKIINVKLPYNSKKQLDKHSIYLKYSNYTNYQLNDKLSSS